MSKPESSIISVPLANAYLNLNQEKDTVRQYEGFNRLNAPYYGGNLTPLYIKKLGTVGESSWVDSDENIYKIENGVFTKTDKDGNVTTLKNDFQTNTCSETIINDTNYKYYYDENNYVVKTDSNNFSLYLAGNLIKVFNDYENFFFDSGRAILIEANQATIYYNGVVVDTIAEENGDKTWYVSPSYTIVNDCIIFAYSGNYYIINADGSLNSSPTVNYVTTEDIEVTYSTASLAASPSFTDGTASCTNLASLEASNKYLNHDGSSFSAGFPEYYAYHYETWFYFFKNGDSNITYDETHSTSRGIGVLNPSNNKIFYEAPILVVSNHCEHLWANSTSRVIVPADSTIYETNNKTNQNYFFIKEASISLSDSVITITLEISEKKLSQYTSHEINVIQITSSDSNLQATFFITCYKKLFGHLLPISQTIDNEVQKITKNYACAATLNSISETMGTYHYVPSLDIPWSTWTIVEPTDESEVSQDFDGLYSSNITDIIQNEKYNIVSTRGFAINISDYFRLLINKGQVQAISMFNDANNLGTIVSSWGNVDIESFNTDGERFVYVDNKDVAHVLEIETFADVNILTCLLNRYIVFNAVGENCYDIQTQSWSRLGIDWNNRFIVADYSESEDTQYYQTSAIFRTTSNTPALSMLFNADYLNKLPITALTPQYAQDINIQIYGATDQGEDVLYLGSFVYSDDEWGTYIDSEYSGTTAETQSDDNILIPTNLFTEFITSYLNDLYVVMYNGFAPLYKSDNASSIIKFNYYLGTVVNDMNLDALFVFQGQYYRLSDGIIYAYTYTDGTLTDTQEVCNVGSMIFVGCSPSEAFFWSYANRTLYRFTGARTVESVLCADSVTAIYATLYDTSTNSLYMSTDRGLFVYNAFGNFILEEISMATNLTSTKLGITYQDENKNIYGLYYNQEDGASVLAIDLETAYYGTSDIQNVINDTLYVKLFNKNGLKKGTVVFSGYIQQNNGETKKLVEKTVTVTAGQFDDITQNLMLRYQPDLQRGVGISWSIISAFPISYIGIGSAQTNELNLPNVNNPVMTKKKYNF